MLKWKEVDEYPKFDKWVSPQAKLCYGVGLREELNDPRLLN